MRISNGLVAATLVGLVIGLVPTLPFDGTGSNEAPPRMSAADALRSGIESLKDGDKNKARQSLQYAAEHGNDMALWQLGKMYANGDGVERDALAADNCHAIPRLHEPVAIAHRPRLRERDLVVPVVRQ